MKDEGLELLPLVDDAGRVIGRLSRGECHRGPGRLHPVVHLHITDGLGRLFLQKRAASKDLEPGKWDTSVGGHVAAGETVEEALARELREELGVDLPPPGSASAPRPLWTYRWEGKRESELVYSFAMRHEGPFSPDPSEVEEGRFWTASAIEESLGKGVFTPNLEHELGIFRREGRDWTGGPGCLLEVR